MRNWRSDAFCYLVVAVVFLSESSVAGDDKNGTRACDTHDPDRRCGKHQRCYQKTNTEVPQCECLRGYEFVGDECILTSTTPPIDTTPVMFDVKTSSGGSSVAAGLLIPTFLIVIGVLLYFGARRYKWLQRFRQFRQNRYGNVLVTRDDDDDDDDPPIA